MSLLTVLKKNTSSSLRFSIAKCSSVYFLQVSSSRQFTSIWLRQKDVYYGQNHNLQKNFPLLIIQLLLVFEIGGVETFLVLFKRQEFLSLRDVPSSCIPVLFYVMSCKCSSTHEMSSVIGNTKPRCGPWLLLWLIFLNPGKMCNIY